MGPIRRFLISLIYRSEATAISAGSFVATDGERSVSLFVADGWKEARVRLSPDGARRIAAQMVEWADVAEKHNAESAESEIITKWKYVVNTAIAEAGKEAGVEQPVSAAPAAL